MGLKVDTAVYCHIGRRANNEDNFYVNGLYMEREQMNKGGRYHKMYTTDLQMYAVCDGMGGAEYGEEASLRAVKALKDYQEKCNQPDHAQNLSRMVAETSENIDEISISKGMPSGSSGSTLAMLVLKDWFYRPVHVGDSRIYLLRDGKLERITRDDSAVQDMVDMGEITLDEAWQHPRKNVITKHLGMPTYGEPLHPTIGKRCEMRQGDRFILCSDGLSDALHDTMIREIAMLHKNAEETASQLAHSALSDMDNVGIASDNITVIVVDILSINHKDSDVRRANKWLLLHLGSAIMTVLTLGGFGYSVYRLVRLIMRD